MLFRKFEVILLAQFIDFLKLVVDHVDESATVAVRSEIDDHRPLVRPISLVLDGLDVVDVLGGILEPRMTAHAVHLRAGAKILEVSRNHLFECDIFNIVVLPPIFLNDFILFLMLLRFLPIRFDLFLDLMFASFKVVRLELELIEINRQQAKIGGQVGSLFEELVDVRPQLFVLQSLVKAVLVVALYRELWRLSMLPIGAILVLLTGNVRNIEIILGTGSRSADVHGRRVVFLLNISCTILNCFIEDGIFAAFN